MRPSESYVLQDGVLVPKTTPQGVGSAVSRRAFLGAAMLGAVGAARPRLTRGPLIAMMGGGGCAWRNPYVTDGLVAMWDGQWNAGGGIHDANATSWTNIITGEKASLVQADGGSIAWGDMSCFFNKQRFAVPINDINAIKVPYDLGVIECGFSFDIDLASSTTGVSVFGRNLYFSCRVNYYAGLYSYDGFNGSICGKTLQPRISALSSPVSVTEYANGVDAVVFDLSQDQSTKRTAALSGSTLPTTDMYIGGINSTVNYAGNIYNIRIYNRVLTDEERHANYDVDVRRFGVRPSIW